MNALGTITMSMHELDRLKVIQAVVDIGLKPGRAAERLGLTVRQVQRLVDRYRESGAAGLASRKRGRPRNRRPDQRWGLVMILWKPRPDSLPTSTMSKNLTINSSEYPTRDPKCVSAQVVHDIVRKALKAAAALLQLDDPKAAARIEHPSLT
jgi:hypothetical protein